ncbi:MAG TPA: hypothetical protein VM733_06140 [Thermoanaerobaculia bacterium]|nr:hypothetical protein [Thermoanaerobaculia bacterium]
MGAFAHTVFHFTSGLHAGETAAVRGANGETLLTYRAFASITGVIAAFLSGIVAVAGIAATVLLLYEQSFFRALMALAMTFAFSIVIALLTPRIQVTLFEESNPALTIAQRSMFPAATYVVSAPNGAQLAELRKSFLSRLGRNRWRVLQNARLVAEAREAGFFGAMLRKVFGKFSRSFETDVDVTSGGLAVARIHRRTTDVLQVTSDAIDRRVLVALATLVFGREP